MATKNYNDSILSKYFLKMSEKNEPIPYMTVISKETGVSNATISRYAKRKGFYNFGEMRATFNKTLNSNFAVVDTRGVEKIFDYESIKIVTSKSTRIIGTFLKERLEFLGADIEIADKDTVWNAGDLTILTTITCESNKIRESLKEIKGKKILITTRDLKPIDRNTKQVVLSEYDIEIRNSYDVSNAIVRIMNWLNEVINVKQIQRENKK